MHWAQMAKAKRFQMYDFGSKERNMEHYGIPYPPEYNITGELKMFFCIASTGRFEDLF